MATTKVQVGFPGGSKTRVNRAGAAVRSDTATVEDLLVIEEWRAAHRPVLNTFQAILRNRTRHKNISVAQRHKRQKTIFGKLTRLPKMELARMDDVAGCRLIFDDIDSLREFRENFHKAKFKHRRRGEIDKYDYISKPKASGYRGIHDVYEYDVNSDVGKRFAGLYVEIQYRTLAQHAWATAVELIGFVTESQPKFQQGDLRYQRAMALASEILARHVEGAKGPFPDTLDRDLVSEFLSIDKDIGLLRMLKGLNSANKAVNEKRNAILMFSGTSELEIFYFASATDALDALFELERQHPKKDIVLVRADTSDEMRLAFRNYFSDAKDFIELIERGCVALSGARSVKQFNAKVRAKPSARGKLSVRRGQHGRK